MRSAATRDPVEPGLSTGPAGIFTCGSRPQLASYCSRPSESRWNITLGVLRLSPLNSRDSQLRGFWCREATVLMSGST